MGGTNAVDSVSSFPSSEDRMRTLFFDGIESIKRTLRASSDTGLVSRLIDRLIKLVLEMKT